MARVVFGLGSNLNDRQNLLVLARQMLQEFVGQEIKASPCVESEPWGFSSENWFLNQVVIFETRYEPMEVLKRTQKIETELGRNKRKGQPYSDRPIDIDLLFYGDKVLHLDDLALPHPNIHQRLFVLLPMAELEPDRIHPVSRKTIRELLDLCEDPGICKWLEA